MKKINRRLIAVLLIIIAVYIYIKSPIIKDMSFIILFSFILAYSLKPIHRYLVIKGLNKRFSAIVIIVIFIAFFIFSFVIIVPSILKEGLNINNKIEEIDKFISTIYENLKVNNNKLFYMIEEALGEKVNRGFVEFSGKAIDNLLSMGENLISLAVVPVITYYFLVDEEMINNKILMIFPINKRNIVRNIVRDVDKVLGRYIVSQFILCLLIGILTFIVLICFKIEFPLLLSLINAVFNIIPYFGPLFGAIPAIFIALMYSTKKAIWVAIFLYIIQQIEGDIVSPKIIGDNISIHPMIIILLLILGGKLGGFIGMVLAVPIGVIIKVLYEDINYYLF